MFKINVGDIFKYSHGKLHYMVVEIREEVVQVQAFYEYAPYQDKFWIKDNHPILIEKNRMNCLKHELHFLENYIE